MLEVEVDAVGILRGTEGSHLGQGLTDVGLFGHAVNLISRDIALSILDGTAGEVEHVGGQDADSLQFLLFEEFLIIKGVARTRLIVSGIAILVGEVVVPHALGHLHALGVHNLVAIKEDAQRGRFVCTLDSVAHHGGIDLIRLKEVALCVGLVDESLHLGEVLVGGGIEEEGGVARLFVVDNFDVRARLDACVWQLVVEHLVLNPAVFLVHQVNDRIGGQVLGVFARPTIVVVVLDQLIRVNACRNPTFDIEIVVFVG